MSPTITARMQIVRILWGALAGAVVIYDLVLPHVRTLPPSGVPPHLAEILATVSLGLAVASFVLPRKFFDQGLTHLQIKVVEEPGGVVGSFGESAPVRRVVANPEEAVAGSFGAFQSPFLIGMSLAEAIALCGFMLGYMGSDMMVASAFFLVALVIMALKFPRVSTLTAAIERVTKAECTIR